MSTAYQAPLVAYDSHAIHGYPPSMPHAGRNKMAVADPNPQVYRQSTHQPQTTQYQLGSNWPPKGSDYSSVASATTTSQHISRQPSPATTASLGVPANAYAGKKPTDSLVFHSLDIPRCISSNGGNLADLAAQMTCLFWFESADELKQAETIRSRPATSPIPRLPALARPHEQFRKWVLSVLSTTQVTQNVILLALLFIYRLKMSSPQVKGRAGSEYRLLVVALMLSNKFLDDNTYTNKTWAEVSSFAVKEIHVMEVEFLSNMRYNLLASEQEWHSWLGKLSCFHEYYERAVRLPVSPVYVPSPTTNLASSPMVSPTNATAPLLPDLGPTTPSITTNLSPSSGRSRNWAAYQANAVSPLAAKPTMSLPPSRKRSFDDDLSDHPSKRPVPLSRINPALATVSQQGPAQAPASQLGALTHQQPPSSCTGVNYMPPTSAPPVTNQVSLPPLQAGMRAMSTVYSQPVSAPMPQQAVPTTAPAPGLPHANFAPSLPSHTPMGYGGAGKNRSPGSLAPFVASPMPDPFANGSGMHTPIAHTPISNSPSFYLQQRNSPYRPIRHVNTLLYPPPSASLDQYHLSVPIPPTQMHYQPLGRPNDVRTGVVPEFLMYNRGAYGKVAHPVQQGHYVP